MTTQRDQLIKSIQQIGSAKLTHPKFEGRSARQHLAVVLWTEAMKGNLRAAELVLKYDLGDEQEALPIDRKLEEALEKVYGEG